MNDVQPTLSRMKTVRVGMEAEACWSGCHCAWKVAMSFFWEEAIAGRLEHLRPGSRSKPEPVVVIGRWDGNGYAERGWDGIRCGTRGMLGGTLEMAGDDATERSTRELSGGGGMGWGWEAVPGAYGGGRLGSAGSGG